VEGRGKGGRGKGGRSTSSFLDGQVLSTNSLELIVIH
jgi:hypothetical protein